MFHLTHRCRNRAFLLGFARDRNAYRAKLREHLGRYDLWLLDYCLISTYVHLLIDAEDRAEVSAFMREVAGEFARAYNRGKARTNAFWGDNFHATLVEGGPYLGVSQNPLNSGTFIAHFIGHFVETGLSSIKCAIKCAIKSPGNGLLG